MKLFINAFTTYSGLEVATFIIAIIAICASFAMIILALKRETNNVFKILSHIILPVISITFLFALMFMRLNTFSNVLSFVVAFGISAVCEAIAFGVAKLINKTTKN